MSDRIDRRGFLSMTAALVAASCGDDSGHAGNGFSKEPRYGRYPRNKP